VSKAFTSEETVDLPEVHARPPPHEPKPLDEHEVERLRSEGAARLGATVVLTHEEDKVEYRLVAEEEADLASGRLSVDSPLGRAILGKHQGDEVRFVRPKGAIEYELLTVKY
jgi:transcription elongation GreA/GreB family factor